MAKKNLKYVAQAKFIAIAEKLGLKVDHQKGFSKITSEVPGKAVYVANTKSVGRVDISGFAIEGIDGVVAHSNPPTKRVTQELDFTQAEPVVLKAFFRVLKNGLMAAGGVIGKNEPVELTPEEIEASVAAACSDEE